MIVRSLKESWIGGSVCVCACDNLKLHLLPAQFDYHAG